MKKTFLLIAVLTLVGVHPCMASKTIKKTAQTEKIKVGRGSLYHKVNLRVNIVSRAFKYLNSFIEPKTMAMNIIHLKIKYPVTYQLFCIDLYNNVFINNSAKINKERVLFEKEYLLKNKIALNTKKDPEYTEKINCAVESIITSETIQYIIINYQSISTHVNQIYKDAQENIKLKKLKIYNKK